MIWHHHYDPGYYGFVELMSEDIKRLPELGLSGYVSCQVVRASFPTGFPKHMHAKLLWKPDADKQLLAEHYFKQSFGKDALLCMDYLSTLSELFVRNHFYKYNAITDPEAILAAHDKLSQIPSVIEYFRPVIERNLNVNNKTHAQSWHYLFIHMEVTLFLAHGLRAKLNNNQEAADQYWSKIVEYLMVNERRIESVFDPVWFIASFERRFKQFAPYRTLRTDLQGKERRYSMFMSNRV